MSKKNKIYVVWVGKTPGVYTVWAQCESQIKNFPGAKFKSFDTVAMAEIAFKRSWQDFYADPSDKKIGINKPILTVPDNFIHGIAVDASSIGNPGIMEYRGVETMTGAEIFRSPIFQLGTNNIGEFLAIVHACALFAERNPGLIIYSDSEIAIKWVKAKKCRTKLPDGHKTKKLHEVVARAEKWLSENRIKNPVKKWETKIWGENPADFGRK